MPRYKIADVVFDAQFIYGYTERLCQKYLYQGDEAPRLLISATLDDIKAEKEKAPEYPDNYLESLAVFRKLCAYILDNADGLIFHSSAIMVDGKAYLFTAPSGTGKSTHARLWRELLGDRAVMVNDDKPIVRFVDGKFYVYGTPWNGKHGLDTNCRAEIKAVCKISQAKENSIRKATAGEMVFTVLNQTVRPENQSSMENLLGLIDKLLGSVDTYVLGCNVSKEAAELSYTTMSGERL
ncbi:MAG: hypothetical protein IJC07_06460 [Clostridia bacterium]|nr:hypothetical protein [Clostridia bacterium]